MKFAPRCRRIAPILLLLASLSASPAHAVSKEMVQLQTQVQELIDNVARLQQSNDQQAGVLKDLVQQTVDSVNKMSVVVNGMQLKLQNQTDAQAAHSDQLSGQVQALNDSLDELKARMQRMEKSLSDLQNQAQSTNAALNALPAGGGAPANGPRGVPATAAPGPSPASPAPDNAAPAAPSSPGPTASGPSAADMYRTAYGDYVAGKYPLASSEFNDLIKAYPDDNLAGNSYFYLGEISNRTQKPSVAVKDYDQVLERYPDNAKIPAAHLHKGEALIALKQTEAGQRELRALVQRFPNSPEAAQAKTRLNALGGTARTRGRLD